MHLFLLSHEHWAPLIRTYGYWLVMAIIALESAGIPVPGEAILITAAIYAGQTHRLSIVTIIAIAVLGAVLGSVTGYWIGRLAGIPVLRRWGGYVGLTESRLRLGQYIFERHGGLIVFVGRFVSVLRAFASLLAGANGLGFARFFYFTSAGSIAWAILFGGGAYYFGRVIHRVVGPIGMVVLIAFVVALVAGALFLRRHEAHLQAKADATAGL